MEEEYGARLGELKEGLSRISKNFSDASAPCGPLSVAAALLDDADWENNWKQYYKPITVGGLQIVPEWLKDRRDESLIPIYLDPGMAFGTGEHETTRMCLELLQELDLKDKTVYDIGCGSGILGIASALLGAKAARLSDIDPTSVLTAKKNAEKNGVSHRLTVRLSDLLSSGAEEMADIVAANISADILIRLSNGISKVLKPGGAAVLSGIISQRLAEVEDAYIKAGFKLVRERTVGDWSAVSLSFEL
jgi:ribosomal protein L11 methyltransferase